MVLHAETLLRSLSYNALAQLPQSLHLDSSVKFNFIYILPNHNNRCVKAREAQVV